MNPTAIALVLFAAVSIVLLALALPNRLYATIGDTALPGVEPGVRPLVVGAAIWAVIGLIGGLFPAIRAARIPIATVMRA